MPLPLEAGWRLILIRKSRTAVNRLLSGINVALTHLCPLSSLCRHYLTPVLIFQPFCLREVSGSSLVSTNHSSAFRPRPLLFAYIHSYFTAAAVTHRTELSLVIRSLLQSAFLQLSFPQGILALSLPLFPPPSLHISSGTFLSPFHASHIALHIFPFFISLFSLFVFAKSWCNEV